ncbi:MAG: hypothetical protein JSR89_10545 [Proteobacteria bacterium]|nr:hypothetical protein [Pseudomonadota bacterium]
MSEDQISKPEGQKNQVGVNVTVAPEDTSKIVKVLVDICSPISETFGLIGDKIRVYRAQQTIKTLNQAKEIADEEGKQIELPPPKFLIPYLNDASLENDGDSSLQEKWAALLVNAGHLPDSIAYFAKSLLANISSGEVKFLDELVTRQKIGELDPDQYVDRQNTLVKQFAEKFERMIVRMDSGEIKTFEEFSEEVASIEASVPELLVSSFNFQTTCTAVATREKYAAYQSGYFKQNMHLFLMLESRNILANRDRTLMEFGSTNKLFALSTLEFTQLGIEVIEKIYPRARLNNAELQNDSRQDT